MSSIAPSPVEIPEGKAESKDDATASMTDLGPEGSNNEIGSARTPWYGTSIVLLSEIMGLGVLGLPFVAATIGWAVTAVSVPVFGAISAYAGHQLKIVKLSHPEITSYAEAGEKLVGPRFGAFTKVCMLLNWGAMAVYFLIAAADGIEAIHNKGFLSCNLNRTLIAAILLVIPVQVRDFHTMVKILSLPSTLALIAVIVIVIVSLVGSAKEDDDGGFAKHTTIGPEPGTSVFDFLYSLSAALFAYQGHYIFFEFMAEMKKPKDFTKTLSASYITMVCVYATIIIVCYGFQGTNVADFLPKSVDPGPAKTAIGVLIVFHIIVVYVVTINPFNCWLHSTLFPDTFRSSSTQGAIHWLLVTIGYIVFAWVIANLIPLFGDLQALLGAMLGAPSVFMWPSLYYLLTCREKNGSWRKTFLSIGPINSSLSLIFMFVITPLFLVLGTWGAVSHIIADIHSAGHPFHC